MVLSDIRLEKENLRSRYKDKRVSLNPKKKLNMDVQIHSRLLSLSEYLNCSTVFTYVSKKIEVNTLTIIKSSMRLGKRVAVPRCIVEKMQMEFYYIKSLEELIPGTFGVLEPNPYRCKKVSSFEKSSLCIVPGFSFDIYGFRLGYGKGYYDRFLAWYAGYTVGLCYSDCVREKLPHGKFDKPVNFLITNQFSKRTS